MNSSQKNPSAHRLKYSDFQIVKTIGSGAYGKVQLVRFHGKQYALKIVDKKKLQREGKEYMAFVQREILMKLNHPGIIKLYTCFQDPKNVYFLLQYCRGGNLKQFIQQNYELIPEKTKKIYVSELVKIIQYLQDVRIVHRDLKPENILLDSEGHLKINDFGTTQYQNCGLISQQFKDFIQKQKTVLGSLQPTIQDLQIDQKDQRSQLQVTRSKSNLSTQQNDYLTIQFQNSIKVNKRRKATFVGTCNYVPPELLQLSQCGFASDIWALGCVIYELYYGWPPFDAENQYEVFEKIKEAKVIFPEGEQVSEVAKDLIKRIFKKNPDDRLGCNSRPGLMLSDLFSHQYFNGINLLTFDSKSYPIPSLYQHHSSQSVNRGKAISRIMYEFIQEKNYSKKEIIYQGTVEKRTFISYNKYYLVLFKDLTLFRIKIEQPEKKCILKIQKQLPMYTYPAQLIEPGIFSLISSEKKYKFKAEDAEKWIEAINTLYTENKVILLANRQQDSKDNSKGSDWESAQVESDSETKTKCESKKISCKIQKD